ncbi:MAG TPA: hypothetical protein VFP80_04440 [Thermoanaerobaculia bacterium]|nr:hypothetical protein [Thermoanaerobaculia bacterium]
MTGAPSEVLIARHVVKLMARPDHDKIERVLSRVGLVLRDGRISRAGGSVTPADCSAYKHAIRDEYGDATYAFTKVNFVLGGCTCDDCTE